MRKNSFLLALLFFVGCACTQKINYNSPSSIKSIVRSVVKITKIYTINDKITLARVQRGAAGTGFSILYQDGVSYILTNQHVCDMKSAATYVVTLSSGKRASAAFVRSDPFADVCLLATHAFIEPLSLAKENATQGDRVITVGGPSNIAPIIVDGIVSGYVNINMKADDDSDGSFEVHFRGQMLSTPIYPGSSGSPVINVYGDVVGIIFAVRREKEHIAFMVPISEVLRFLNTSEYVQ